MHPGDGATDASITSPHTTNESSIVTRIQKTSRSVPPGAQLHVLRVRCLLGGGDGLGDGRGLLTGGGGVGGVYGSVSDSVSDS